MVTLHVWRWTTCNARAQSLSASHLALRLALKEQSLELRLVFGADAHHRLLVAANLLSRQTQFPSVSCYSCCWSPMYAFLMYTEGALCESRLQRRCPALRIMCLSNTHLGTLLLALLLIHLDDLIQRQV